MAERRAIDRFAAALFAGERGNVVKGVVAGVTGAGAFVSLGDGAADGFLPARTLPLQGCSTTLGPTETESCSQWRSSCSCLCVSTPA